MLARKVKGKIIRIYPNEYHELESPTALRLNYKEVYELIQAGDNWSVNSGTKVLETHYNYKDRLDRKWVQLVHVHQAQNFDASQKYENNVGTRVLIRDPEKHTIRVAAKSPNQLDSINIMTLNDMAFDEFYKDCEKGIAYKNIGAHILSLEDEKYNYWDRYMNGSYLWHSSN